MIDLYNIRYFALGHSYLRHGLFNGWEWPDPQNGIRGMAASSYDKDYFARFKYYLKEKFVCNINSAAKNVATYERLCVDGATREDYTRNELYDEIKGLLSEFEPNLVTVFLGNGNTVANDYKNISVFFDTLFNLIKRTVKEDSLVIAVSDHPQTDDVGKACLCYAKKYGFAFCDVSFIHEDTSRENPYSAFMQYPEYDKFIEEFEKQNGTKPVEFRTHPGDLGMDAIGKTMFDVASPLIPQYIKPIQVTCEEYKSILNENKKENEKVAQSESIYVANAISDRFDFDTDHYSEGVIFSGFNVFVKNSFLCGNSAPGASFNVYHNKLSLKSDGYNAFVIKANIHYSTERDLPEYFELSLTTEDKVYKYKTEISANELTEYTIDISDVKGTIKGFNILPSVINCNADIDYICFKRLYNE